MEKYQVGDMLVVVNTESTPQNHGYYGPVIPSKNPHGNPDIVRIRIEGYDPRYAHPGYPYQGYMIGTELGYYSYKCAPYIPGGGTNEDYLVLLKSKKGDEDGSN